MVHQTDKSGYMSRCICRSIEDVVWSSILTVNNVIIDIFKVFVLHCIFFIVGGFEKIFVPWKFAQPDGHRSLRIIGQVSQS